MATRSLNKLESSITLVLVVLVSTNDFVNKGFITVC